MYHIEKMAIAVFCDLIMTNENYIQYDISSECNDTGIANYKLRITKVTGNIQKVQ